jgi:erfK/ybiS/ycfS/ynhG family protein
VHKSIASRGLQVSNDLIDAVVREETGLPVEVAYR